MSTLTSSRLRGASASSFISAGFALGWGLSGSLALPESGRLVGYVLALLVTSSLFAAAFSFAWNAPRFPVGTNAAPPSPFRTPSYRVAVLAMIVAIPVAGRWLTVSGHGEAVMPVVAIIVGLHFIGLIQAFRTGIFAWVAVAFCAVGAVGLFLPPQLGEWYPRQAVVGLGCALVLWVAVLPLVARMWRQLAKA